MTRSTLLQGTFFGEVFAAVAGPGPSPQSLAHGFAMATWPWPWHGHGLGMAPDIFEQKVDMDHKINQK